MKKKILSVMLTSVVLTASVFAFTGCGDSQAENTVPSNDPMIAEEPGESEDAAAETYEDLPEWTNLEITILGKEYKLPCKVSDVLAADESLEVSSLHQELVEGTVGAYDTALFMLENETENCQLSVDADNEEHIEGAKVVDLPVTRLSVDSGRKLNIPEVDFYGIKLGDSIDVAEEKLGTPYEITERYYKYLEEISAERSAMVIIEYDDDTREIEQIRLYYVFTEDFMD